MCVKYALLLFGRTSAYEGVSLFSTVMLFHLAHSQKAEDLSPEVAIPETFFVPKYGLYSKG